LSQFAKQESPAIADYTGAMLQHHGSRPRPNIWSECWGYQLQKEFRRWIKPFRHNTGPWQTPFDSKHCAYAWHRAGKNKTRRSEQKQFNTKVQLLHTGEAVNQLKILLS